MAVGIPFAFAPFFEKTDPLLASRIMQAADLIELGAFAAVHQAQLMTEESVLGQHDLEEYWVASKCRLDRWSRALREVQGHASGAISPLPPGFQAALSEILTGEMLTRVWSAVLCGNDEQRRVSQGAPIAHSVFQGHLQARNRALAFLARGEELSVVQRIRLDGLRRRSERWADILLAHTSQPAYISNFAVDPQRALRYSRDFHGRRDSAEQLWPRLQSTLRLAFREETGLPSRNSDLNRRIAGSVLAAFAWPQPSEPRLSSSLWLERIERLAQDSEKLLDGLLHNEV